MNVYIREIKLPKCYKKNYGKRCHNKKKLVIHAKGFEAYEEEFAKIVESLTLWRKLSEYCGSEIDTIVMLNIYWYIRCTRKHEIDKTNHRTIEGEHFQGILFKDGSTIRSADCYINHAQIQGLQM